ncbi:hypothetical protein [Lunatibacter salilacus]|uniref:hypothetical protein n=1 Tax=Lunatibacter salilacus TaxID=2483804 RepID=UPI00131E7EFA|nr:hypothetical protein [Lunatibacter salilacus]
MSPFSIDIEPMSRLLLVNFEKDPDTVYVGFEPQVFDDNEHGKGHLVIGWRKDGKVDVYHEPTLTLNADKYDIVGKGLENLIACDFEVAFFEINEAGVQANYMFNDLQNRKVSIKISEKNSKKRRPFGLLAPMGSVAEKPSAMPLVMLQDFYFVRRLQTDFEVFIDNVQHQPDKLPVPMDWTSMYFARYSPKPLIGRLNPEFDGLIFPVDVDQGIKTLNQGDYTFDFSWKNDSIAIQKISRVNDVHPVSITFEDAFPDIESLATNTAKHGEFTIEADPSIGTLPGDYSVENANDTIKIELRFDGWKPRPSKLSLYFIYAVAGVFKKWPATYVWTAFINKSEDGNYYMKSKWKRIKI